ncbi:hypothetical protein [Tetragenococcus phage phiYA5_2]|nr:hypothetical protein [Tetragenococcus phage phiYA5_2]
MNEEENNQMRDMMKTSYDDVKLDKSGELNASMSIQETSQDQYESKIHNVGGSEDGE